MEGRPLDENELIERSRHGDSAAFEQLVRAHQGMAIRIAYLVVRDHAEAEDVTQDALVKAYGSLGRFREDSPFRPWLLRIVRNEALNHLRSSNRRQNLAIREGIDPVSGGAAPSPEIAVVSAADRARLLEAIDQLPKRYGAVITHRFLLELSEDETASVLGIAKGTVKSRTSRGLGRLRQIIGEDE